jgi:L-2-hydroxyglutarate oxidase LhgO
MTFPDKTVVIVGGGFSGATFGLKLHRRCPGWRIVIAEPKKDWAVASPMARAGPTICSMCRSRAWRSV